MSAPLLPELQAGLVGLDWEEAVLLYRVTAGPLWEAVHCLTATLQLRKQVGHTLNY